MLAAVFSALIAVLTAYSGMLFPMPNGGYMHIGDSVVFLAGCLLPFPYSVFAAAIGGCLADILVGGAIAYAPFTLIIKGFMALVFIFRKPEEKLLTRKTFLLAFCSSAINYVGYFFVEWILFGLPAAIAVVVSPPLQTIFSYAVFVCLILIFDKRKFFRT